MWSLLAILPSLLLQARLFVSDESGSRVGVCVQPLKEKESIHRIRYCPVMYVSAPNTSRVSTLRLRRTSTRNKPKESVQLALDLAHTTLTGALSIASVLGATRFAGRTRVSDMGASQSSMHSETQKLKTILVVFATFSLALLSINITSHSSDAPPIHVILVIPFVLEKITVLITPAIPSLFDTLNAWLGRFHTESAEITTEANREVDSLDDIGFAIISIDRIPVNVTGHFNDIFLGQHETFGQVALRRPRISESNYPDAVRRFQRESKTWRSLDHPCILPLLGTFTRDEHIYFVSPFAANGCLLEYLARHPHINCILLLCGIADAIAYLHKNEIVHGDIKAGNVLINGYGCPLLCDFGLAKMPYCKTSTERKGAGTVRWQSPEIWDNTPRSLASDTYAFAMTIAEILTRDVPFAHLHTEVAVIKAVLTYEERPLMTPQASPTGISYENCWSVANSCWPTLPQDRISMAEALQRLQADPSLTVETGGTSSEPEPNTNPGNLTDLASNTSQ